MAKHILLAVAVLMFASSAWAQDEKKKPKPKKQAESIAPAVDSSIAPPDDDELLRGFYVEAHVGAGYTVISSELGEEVRDEFPTLEGKDEGLGAGSQVNVAIGIDITDSVALEVIGGAALLSGTRPDRVRDLGLLFGGAQARFALKLGSRLFANIKGGAVYVQADNRIEEATTGIGATGALGIEYFVHVRHFSVGIDVAGLAPLDPMRVFLAVKPHIKYTF